MWFAYVGPYLVPYVQVIYVPKVGLGNTFWHASFYSYLLEQLTIYLIETFVYVYRSSRNLIACESLEFYV